MLRVNPQRLRRLGHLYVCTPHRSCLSAPCSSRPAQFRSTVLVSDRGYAKSVNTSTAVDEPAATEERPLDTNANSSGGKDEKKARAKFTRSRRPTNSSPKKTKQARAATSTKSASPEPPSTTTEQPAGPDVIRQVFESLKKLEDSYASINKRLSHVQKGTEGHEADPSDVTKAQELEKFVKRQTSKLGGKLKTVSGTLDVLKSVLSSQQIPLDHLAKRPAVTSTSSKTDESNLATAIASSTSATQSVETEEAKASGTTPPIRKVRSVVRKPNNETSAPSASEPGKLSGNWTSIANRLFRGDKTALVAGASGAAALDAKGASSGDASETSTTKAGKSRRKSKLNVQRVVARSLDLEPIEVPDAPEVPKLSYGLERVLFNPGVYHLQDPRSRVYNFDPYLSNIMPINEFDFNALKKYVTSSKDNTLVGLAAKLRKKYTGSTSSMTQMLSHFHYLLSAWRPINAANLSRQFNPDFTSFTQILRAPAAAFLHLKDDVYAIDADKEYDSASILSMLGKSMEKLLTLPKDEFERYRRANSGQITEEERNAEEAFHYTTMGDFLMRSQLDAYDPRLPGSGMFDLKTRAVVSIRMDSQGFQKGLGYEIRKRFGQWESFEREYFDMIRAAFLKYSLQVRMGRMDGIFVAFHNTQRIFGFQYVSLEEMDLSLHGTENRTLGDQEFKLSLHLLNKVLDRATERFPGRSIRLHVETRPTDPPFMYVFAKPVTSEEIEKVQTSNQTAVAEYEKQILGLAQEESEPEAPEPEAEQLVSQEDETVSIDEARNQLRQTQAFWEEMQEKVDEAVEDDALGIGHVREAIQDALEQSGLLKARTPEEARWYVDGLLEALTPKQANDVRESDGKENEQVESLVSGTVASTTASAQGDGLGAAQADTPTSSETTSVAQETGEAQPPQEVQDTSIPSTDRADSGVRGSRDLGLKDLILQVATRVDEKAEVEEYDDDTASDVSKLRTFERILSELVARSRQAESGPTTSTTSPADDLSSETSDGLESSIRSAAAAAATAESIKEAASDAGEKSREADTELDIKKGELLGMVVTIRNKVNGQYVPRPDPLSSRSLWVLEYSIEDLPGDRAKTIYKALQDRRKKVLVHDDPKDREKQWYSMFSGKLETFSSKGKQYRKEQDALSKTSPIHVLGEEEPLTWDEAFGHQKEWKTLSPDETNDS
ncbi:hypothetical protein CDEST_04792 [Colletotrichum destructivum]|uniref:mRNA degradation protein n=1 Tax=Colletotrichum destructivum TaxID=34406 RepID=A0AAX4I9Y2_9PEZI|nr:hypothetical protein CDEST_04792 [Colletotrichum destructivum]